MEFILGRHCIALLAEYIPYILHRLNSLFPVALIFFFLARVHIYAQDVRFNCNSVLFLWRKQQVTTFLWRCMLRIRNPGPMQHASNGSNYKKQLNCICTHLGLFSSAVCAIYDPCRSNEASTVPDAA